jgi:HPr kinase/phosphorylase
MHYNDSILLRLSFEHSISAGAEFCGGRQMSVKYQVPLSKLIDEYSLRVMYTPTEPAHILIQEADINRPGLQLAGFFDIFDNQRIQIIGQSEITFLKNMSPIVTDQRIDALFAHRPAAVIVTRDNLPQTDDSGCSEI